MTCIVCIPFIQQSDSVICQFDFFLKLLTFLQKRSPLFWNQKHLWTKPWHVSKWRSTVDRL